MSHSVEGRGRCGVDACGGCGASGPVDQVTVNPELSSDDSCARPQQDGRLLVRAHRHRPAVRLPRRRQAMPHSDALVPRMQIRSRPSFE